MAAEVASASVVVVTCGGSGRRCDAVSLRGLAARYVGEVSAEDSRLVVGEFDQQLANGDLTGPPNLLLPAPIDPRQRPLSRQPSVEQHAVGDRPNRCGTAAVACCDNDARSGRKEFP
jgi:hypothetical protein